MANYQDEVRDEIRKKRGGEEVRASLAGLDRLYGANEATAVPPPAAMPPPGGGLNLPPTASGPTSGGAPVMTAKQLGADEGTIRANNNLAQNVTAWSGQPKSGLGAGLQLPELGGGYQSMRPQPGPDANPYRASLEKALAKEGASARGTPVERQDSRAAGGGPVPFDAVKPGGAGGGAGKPMDWDQRTTESLGMTGPEYESAKGEVDELGRLRTQGEQEAAAHRFEGSEKLAQLHGKRVELERQHGEALKAIDAHTTEMTSRAMKNYEDLARDARNMKIDPNRRYHNASTLANIGQALALALGTAGSSLTHTPNVAFQMIHDADERDIDAQREEIASARANVGEAKGMYMMARENGMDDRTSANLQHEASIAHVQADALEAMQHASSVEERDKALLMANEAAARRAELRKAQAQQFGQTKYALMHPKAAANPAGEKALAELQAHTTPAQEAIGRTQAQGEDQAGYGYLARVGRFLGGDTGPLTTAEGRAGQEDVRTMVAQKLALTGRPLRGSAVDDEAARVKTPEDKRRLAGEVARLISASQTAKIDPRAAAAANPADQGPELNE